MVWTGSATLHVLGLIGGNALLLFALPKLMSRTATATTLVVLDTILVPATLYTTGTTGSELFVVYFGIIMIAGASGNLKRTIALASLTWMTYLGFSILTQRSIPLGTVLLSLPFLIVVTLFYGASAEVARRERAERERLAHVALHDELTDLPNRRQLMDCLSRALSEAKRFGSPLSCAVLDLDGFKPVNDVHGHNMGDQVLRDIAGILNAEKRGYDLAGRIGGDEFVWILPRADQDGAMAAAERFREAVAAFPFGKTGAPFKLTSSIGITTYAPGETPHPTPTELLKAADVALYAAKRQGGNRTRMAPWDRVAGSPYWDSPDGDQRRDSGGGQSTSVCLPQEKHDRR